MNKRKIVLLGLLLLIGSSLTTAQVPAFREFTEEDAENFSSTVSLSIYLGTNVDLVNQMRLLASPEERAISFQNSVFGNKYGVDHRVYPEYYDLMDIRWLNANEKQFLNQQEIEKGNFCPKGCSWLLLTYETPIDTRRRIKYLVLRIDENGKNVEGKDPDAEEEGATKIFWLWDVAVAKISGDYCDIVDVCL